MLTFKGNKNLNDVIKNVIILIMFLVSHLIYRALGSLLLAFVAKQIIYDVPRTGLPSKWP